MTNLVLLNSTCMKTESKAKRYQIRQFYFKQHNQKMHQCKVTPERHKQWQRAIYRKAVSQQPKTSHTCSMSGLDLKQKTSIHDSTDNNPEQISKDVAASSEDSSNSFEKQLYCCPPKTYTFQTRGLVLANIKAHDITFGKVKGDIINHNYYKKDVNVFGIYLIGKPFLSTKKTTEKLENPNFGLIQYQSGTGVLEITLPVPKMAQTYICLSNEMMYMEHIWFALMIIAELNRNSTVAFIGIFIRKNVSRKTWCNNKNHYQRWRGHY